MGKQNHVKTGPGAVGGVSLKPKSELKAVSFLNLDSEIELCNPMSFGAVQQGERRAAKMSVS